MTVAYMSKGQVSRSELRENHPVARQSHCEHGARYQSLGNLTPDTVYDTASGGGARIIDKFSKNGAAPNSCVKDGRTSLNQTDFCLDGWVHFKGEIENV